MSCEALSILLALGVRDWCTAAHEPHIVREGYYFQQTDDAGSRRRRMDRPIEHGRVREEVRFEKELECEVVHVAQLPKPPRWSPGPPEPALLLIQSKQKHRERSTRKLIYLGDFFFFDPEISVPKVRTKSPPQKEAKNK